MQVKHFPVGVVILAAGASTRMGTPKQLLSYRGRSFLANAVEVAIASMCRPLVVVLGAYAELLQHEVNHPEVQVVENLQWNEGMSTSIRCGIKMLEAAPEEIEAAVLMLCDQPFVSPEVINQLVEAYYLMGKPIVASEYAGTRGVPALFSSSFFSELANLKSSEGAKQVIKRCDRNVFSISFAKGAIDIDTPKDYELLQSTSD